jgi:hypothetical protein
MSMLGAPVLGTGPTLCEPESNRFALSTHDQSALPRRRVVLASRVSDYRLVSVKKISLPISFLNTRIQLAQFHRKIVRLALNCRNAHRADKLHFRSRGARLCR